MQLVVMPVLIALGLMSCAGASYGQATIKYPKRSGTDVNVLEPIECGWGAEHFREPYFEFLERTLYAPEGFFLLIRRGKELGALRFTEVHHGYGKGDWTQYESYYQDDGSGSLTADNAVKRVGREDMNVSLGYAPFIIERGRTERVRVGPWRFGGLGAGEVHMYLYGTEFEDRYRSPIPYLDPGFEFAATSARDVREIDARDSRLTWFRYVALSTKLSDGSNICMTREISLAVSGLPK